MPAQIEKSRSGKPSLVRRGVAVVVLAVAAWIVFHLVVHVVLWLVTVLVVIAAIVGIGWAIKTLL